MSSKRGILTVIVLAQFCCTSLWFAGNAVMTELIQHFGLPGPAVAWLTSAVQLGFISGTLVFALLTVADRFPPSRVFFWSALLGATFNLGVIVEGQQLGSLVLLRFATGFFLAGIYPVGMKIAADYFDQGLGQSLGFLVGALVLGTAFPHLLRGLLADLPWRAVLMGTSALAVLGGLLMYLLVPDGPYRKAGQGLDLSAVWRVFQNRRFRAAAFGYFGHMWELYAFWAFVPVVLTAYQLANGGLAYGVSWWSIAIIGIGGLACVLGAYLARSWGTQRTAFVALSLSGLCCLLSPGVYLYAGPTRFLGFYLFWGMVVIADSPLFSTLVAQNAVPEIKGTALTIVNCSGFAITIFSIQLLDYCRQLLPSAYLYLALVIGPILGLWALTRSPEGPPAAEATPLQRDQKTSGT